MDLVKLHEALGEANRGLNEVSTQFEALQARKNQLESVVSSLSILLGEPLPAQLSNLPTPAPVAEHTYLSEEASKSEPLPQWKMAMDLLSEFGRPMTVPEMMDRLILRGEKVQGDGLRVAMIRKPEIFTKPAYGQYGLRAWGTSATADHAGELEDSEGEIDFETAAA